MEKEIIAMLVIQVIIIIWQDIKIRKLTGSKSMKKPLRRSDLVVEPVEKWSRPIYSYSTFEYTEPNEVLNFFREAKENDLRVFVLASGSDLNKSWIIYEDMRLSNTSPVK